MDAALSPTASQCAKLVMLKSEEDESVTITAFDLAKRVFQLHGAVAAGAIIDEGTPAVNC